MNKKLICLLSTAIFLVGCQNNGASSVNINPAEETCVIKEDVNIDFLCMLNNTFLPKLQTIIDNFKEIEPHIKVNLFNPSGSGQYSTLEKGIVTGFFEDDYPDISQCYADDVVKYLHYDKVTNVDTYINNSDYGLSAEDKQDYIQSFLEEGSSYSVDGTYSLPFCKSSEVMYYNADKLIGLELPGINEGKPIDDAYLNSLTWEELFDNLCPALENYDETHDQKLVIHKGIDGNDVSHPYVVYDSTENFFITLAKQYEYGYTSVGQDGKGQINFNNANMRALVKSMRQYRQKGYLETGTTVNGWTSDYFTANRSLFSISSTAGLSYNTSENFKIGAARIPTAKNKPNISINQGPSICIFKHFDKNGNLDTNRELASFLLWKYITNQENTVKWELETDYMGIRLSSYTAQEYINALNNKKDLAKAANLQKIAEISANLYNTDVFRGSSEARTYSGQLFKSCLLSNDIDAEIEDLFDNCVESINYYLE